MLDVSVSNGGDPAYEAEMDVRFPPDVSYVGMGGDEEARRLHSPDIKNDTWLRFRLGNPFKGVDPNAPPPTEGEGETEVEVNTLRLQLRFTPSPDIEEKLVQFYLSANTSSEQSQDPSTFVNLMVVRRAEVRLAGGGFPEEIHYGYGPVKGESAMRDLREVGPPLVHKFLVTNGGPSGLDVLTVEVNWPHQVC